MSTALNTVVRDEEHRILALLSHAAGYCDELVVVVDGLSSDATYDLAVGFGATVIPAAPTGICESLRPLAAENTRSDWILVLDGDEVIADEHVDDLVNLDRDRWKSAMLPRLNLVDGVPITDKLDGQVRYFEKGAVTYGVGLHTRIKPLDETTMFHPRTPGWIIHTKTHAEWQVDDDRWRRVMARSV